MTKPQLVKDYFQNVQDNYYSSEGGPYSYIIPGLGIYRTQCYVVIILKEILKQLKIIFINYL